MMLAINFRRPSLRIFYLRNVLRLTSIATDDAANFPVCPHWEVTQGPQGFSFWIFFDFFDLFADLARACFGFKFLGASVQVVRGPASTYGSRNRTLSGPVRP